MGPQEEMDRVLPFLEHARATHPELVLSLDTWRVRGRGRGGAVRARPGQRHLGGARPRAGPRRRPDRRRRRLLAHRWPAAADRPGQGDLRPRPARRGPGRAANAGRRARRRPSEAGIPDERILVDPTLDFGKTTAHSLEVLRHTAEVAQLGFPILQALSRKDFVGESLGLEADDRLEGTLAATAVAAWLGATVFRAHDVRATRRVVDMVAVIRGDRMPVRAVRGV